MFTSVVNVPNAVGVNTTANVPLVPPLNVPCRLDENVKRDAFGPVKYTLLIESVPTPVFWTEKTREELVPKSVKLVIVGVRLAGGIMTPFPRTTLAAVGGAVVVKPATTPPGLTQFDTEPVSAM